MYFYVKKSLNIYIGVHYSTAGSWFPGLAVNNAYTQVQQKIAIANIVGQEQADKYVTSHQFLSRGHLAAKSDYVFATGQRATFWFINAAPQWQPFNGGNWNWLEQVNLHITFLKNIFTYDVCIGTNIRKQI